jgi:hypothetical protein
MSDSLLLFSESAISTSSESLKSVQTWFLLNIDVGCGREAAFIAEYDKLKFPTRPTLRHSPAWPLNIFLFFPESIFVFHMILIISSCFSPYVEH